MKPTPGLMWGTATLMVTIVSCCSLVGVSIMPLISGRFYKSFITLFTGLAVGSLLGSAIFSLVPQAFNIQTQADKAYLWKSLIIFLGIYMFYCSERIMRIYFERKTREKNDNSKYSEPLQLTSNLNSETIQDDDNGHEDSRKTTEKFDGDKILPNTCRSSITTKQPNEDSLTEIDLKKDNCNTVGEEGNEKSSVGVYARHSQTHHHHHHYEDSIRPHEIITRALKGDSSVKSQTTGVANTLISGPPVVDVPRRANEIAPVAWMIIIGDGLHNFIDGLSIGAAFTESIYQGMIICIAVIFEELPHELGDFAVLISSGMTVRQALGFNFLSACTCYIGMVFGIILGDTTQSASYIFALAAGMFFYISLVDMMGELSAALEECKHSTRDYVHLLLMQNIGILSGISIIFSLSLLGPGG